MARLLDGRAVCKAVLEEVTAEVSRLRSTGVWPTLGVILVGHRKDSVTYVHTKKRSADRCGIRCVDAVLGDDVSEEELIGQVDAMNGRSDVHGILVQLPLPSHIRAV
jgi:methylenetetrahydrofolate dehydrogenase (NADP+)/methenyltetrahydrofolate cyclohydrolase